MEEKRSTRKRINDDASICVKKTIFVQVTPGQYRYTQLDTSTVLGIVGMEPDLITAVVLKNSKINSKNNQICRKNTHICVRLCQNNGGKNT